MQSVPIFALGNYIEDRLSAIYNRPISTASTYGTGRLADMVGVCGQVTYGVYRPHESVIPMAMVLDVNNGVYRPHESLIP